MWLRIQEPAGVSHSSMGIGVADSLAKIVDVKIAIEQRRAAEERARGGSHDHDTGVFILAAANPLEEAGEPEPENGGKQHKHGYLTEAFLYALLHAQGSSNGDISIANIVDKTIEQLHQITNDQSPLRISRGQDFMIERK